MLFDWGLGSVGPQLFALLFLRQWLVSQWQEHPLAVVICVIDGTTIRLDAFGFKTVL